MSARAASGFSAAPAVCGVPERGTVVDVEADEDARLAGAGQDPVEELRGRRRDGRRDAGHVQHGDAVELDGVGVRRAQERCRRPRAVVVHAMPGVLDVEPGRVARVPDDRRHVDPAGREALQDALPQRVGAQPAEPRRRVAERGHVSGHVRLGTAGVDAEGVGGVQSLRLARCDHRHRLSGGEQHPAHLQVGDGSGVHVVERLVLARHRPDERVRRGADAGVQRPARRDDRLPVGDDEVPRLLALAEQVDDPGVVRNVEVEVALGAAVVGVRGHGVPHRAGVQLRHAHDDLAAADAVLVDVLVERATVARHLVAELAHGALAGRDQLRRVGRVRGGGEQVELRDVSSGAGERHLADAAAEVEAGAVHERRRPRRRR